MGKFNSFAPYDNAATMDEYVEEGKNLVFSRDNNLFKSRYGEVTVPTQTLICRYYDSLKSYIIDKTLTKDEQNRYKYNPRFLSYDLYGTPELWADILYINNMVSVAEFNKSSIKVFSTSIIDAIIEIKLIVENDMIDNRKTLKEGGN